MEWKTEYLILIPLGWSLVQQVQQGKQMAVLQKTVDILASQMSLFLKSEIDILKDVVSKK